MTYRIIKLIVGDWSGDGHEKTIDYHYNANRTKEQLEKAYAKGSERVGVAWTESVCVEYQDYGVPLAVRNKLKAYGIVVDVEYIDTRVFADVWMKIALMGDSLLAYRPVKSEEIAIGGYGLFEKHY